MKHIWIKPMLFIFLTVLIVFLSWYRCGVLYFNATAAGYDNTLADNILVSNYPFVLSGLLLGLAFLFYRRSTYRFITFCSLCFIACFSLIYALLMNCSLVSFINYILVTKYPERLADKASLIYTMFLGFLLFGMGAFYSVIIKFEDVLAYIRKQNTKL